MSHTASKTKGLVWLVAGILFAALLACGISPLAHMVPWRWEEKLGDAIGVDEGQHACENSPAQRDLLKRLVARLYPVTAEDKNFPVHVELVQGKQVNAFATLGGQIYVYAGLLAKAQSPDELAGVLAHEMEHVYRRHIMQSFITRMFTSAGIHLVLGDAGSGQWVQYFMHMSFTRSQETQADEGGLRRLQAAHIDNKGFRQFFARMEEEGASSFLSDHPSNSERIAMADDFANQDTTPIMTAAEWASLKNSCR